MTIAITRQLLVELVATSCAALARYPFRTLLSAIAVAGGIASVVAMMAVAEGARAETIRQLENFGARTLLVRSRTGDDDPSLRGRQGALTIDDARSLATLVPAIAHLTPVIHRYVTASGPKGQRAAILLGVDSAFHKVRSASLAIGRPLVDSDRRGRRVCIIGATLAADLFAPQLRLPAPMRIDDEWFQVVGVLAEGSVAKLDDGEQYAANLDRVVLAPVNAVAGVAADDPIQAVTQIWMSLAPSADLEAVRPQVDRAMMRLHGGVRDFEVVLPTDLLQQRSNTQRIFNVVVGAIAGLALLVGGLGITNVLLAAVVERTPEIGLRRVVGATRAFVTAQFLLESVLTTTVGGLFGVGSGALLASSIEQYSGWPVQFSVAVASWGWFCAMAVGACAGVYPAIRAARLQPIDAVRFE